LNRPILQLVTTGQQSLVEVESLLSRIPQDMIDMLQIREKHRNAKELREWVLQCKKALPSTAVILNDRVDAAITAHADGIQLTCQSIPITEARHLLSALSPPYSQAMSIGCSVHSVEEAIEAERHGADYIIFGHIFSTHSKQGLKPRGIAALEEVVHATKLPVIAIGGIQPEHIEEVLSSGCSGIAVLSGVFQHPEPASALKLYRYALDQYSSRRKRQ
jgi:thiamine-phosphate diphosphorylase